MHAYAAHHEEIRALWERVEQRVRGMPASLAALGRRFLDSIGDGALGHRAYFSSELSPPLLYLPIWLDEALRIEAPPQGVQHQLAVDGSAARAPILEATMWGYLAIRIQDDTIDDPGRFDYEFLLFSNLCLDEMYRLLQTVHACDTPFWPAFRRAREDFTRFSLDEQWQVRSDTPYSEEMFKAHAGKVAFARVPLLAVAARWGRLDLEPVLARLIHTLGVAYGLTNDVLGWPRDLRSGQRTYLFARAGVDRDGLGGAPGGVIPDAGERRIEALRERLYDQHLLITLLDEAGLAHREAQKIAEPLRLLPFAAFTAERLAWLERQKTQVRMVELQRALGRRA